MRSVKPFLIALATATLLAVGAPAMAQSPGAPPPQQPNGPPPAQSKPAVDPGEAQKKLGRMLGRVHEKPVRKAKAMENLRQQILAHGGQNVEQKLAACSAILDQAPAMNDAAFKAHHKELSYKMVRVLFEMK